MTTNKDGYVSFRRKIKKLNNFLINIILLLLVNKRSDSLFNQSGGN